MKFYYFSYSVIVFVVLAIIILFLYKEINRRNDLKIYEMERIRIVENEALRKRILPIARKLAIKEIEVANENEKQVAEYEKIKPQFSFIGYFYDDDVELCELWKIANNNKLSIKQLKIEENYKVRDSYYRIIEQLFTCNIPPNGSHNICFSQKEERFKQNFGVVNLISIQDSLWIISEFGEHQGKIMFKLSNGCVLVDRIKK